MIHPQKSLCLSAYLFGEEEFFRVKSCKRIQFKNTTKAKWKKIPKIALNNAKSSYNLRSKIWTD